MRTPIVPLGLALLAACAPAAAFSQAPAPEEATAAEYGVYSAVLGNVYPESARTAYLVVDSTLGSFPFGVDIQDFVLWNLRRMPEVSPALVRAYQRANEHPAVLEEERFHTRIPVRVIGGEELTRLHEESGKGGPTGYPDSVPAREDIRFSRVGFSDDGRYALLHVLTSCGGLCGEGRLLLLERRDGAWVLVASRRTVRA